MTGHYGSKTGVETTAVVSPCSQTLFGISGFFDLKKQELKTYNAIAELSINDTKLSVEHVSLPGANLSFGNWVARLHMKAKGVRIGGRALFCRDSGSTLFELGGKYKKESKNTIRWKVGPAERRSTLTGYSHSGRRRISGRARKTQLSWGALECSSAPRRGTSLKMRGLGVSRFNIRNEAKFHKMEGGGSQLAGWVAGGTGMGR